MKFPVAGTRLLRHRCRGMYPLAALLFLTSLSCGAAPSRKQRMEELLPPAARETIDFKKVKRRRFGSTDLKLHIYEPNDRALEQGQRPCAILFFGGGFEKGSPRSMEPHCRYLTGHGMVAIAPEYRTHERFGTTPRESLYDAKSAVRWVYEHAGELNIDTNRIILGGGSAGAHLALASVMIDEINDPEDNPDSVINPAALALIKPPVGTTLGIEDNWLNGLGAQLSPMNHIRPGLPPMVIFHGTADAVIPFSTVEHFSEGMRDAGNQVDLVRYPGREHDLAVFYPGDGRDFFDVMSRMVTFFKEQQILTEP